jgi:hypothetical protein
VKGKNSVKKYEVLTLSTVVECRLILNAVIFRGFGGFGFISLVSVFLTGTSPLDPTIKYVTNIGTIREWGDLYLALKQNIACKNKMMSLYSCPERI